jgi:hypothetical protein
VGFSWLRSCWHGAVQHNGLTLHSVVCAAGPWVRVVASANCTCSSGWGIAWGQKDCGSASHGCPPRRPCMMVCIASIGATNARTGTHVCMVVPREQHRYTVDMRASHCLPTVSSPSCVRTLFEGSDLSVACSAAQLDPPNVPSQRPLQDVNIPLRNLSWNIPLVLHSLVIKCIWLVRFLYYIPCIIFSVHMKACRLPVDHTNSRTNHCIKALTEAQNA